MIKFKRCNLSTYEALIPDPDAMYFITDVDRVYMGSKLITNKALSENIITLVSNIADTTVSIKNIRWSETAPESQNIPHYACGENLTYVNYPINKPLAIEVKIESAGQEYTSSTGSNWVSIPVDDIQRSDPRSIEITVDGTLDSITLTTNIN